jgi:hypothetical protein
MILQEILEGAEAADITGKYAPTNQLLKPEFQPKQSTMRPPKTEPMDDFIDYDKIDHITPGSGRSYPDTNKASKSALVRSLDKQIRAKYKKDYRNIP